MSDANKYVNTYIDIAVGYIHRYVTDEIKLKTDIKVANDLIAEKNEIIGSLQEKLNKNIIDGKEIEKLKANADSWENQYNAMKNKASHIDTMANQLTAMKKLLQEKDGEIIKLKREIETFQNYNKEIDSENDINIVINETKKDEEVLSPENETILELKNKTSLKNTDDF